MGDRIRRARLAAGLSQQQLAGPGLTRSFVCRIEHGKVRPSPRTLEQFAARLGRPPDFFTLETAGSDQLQAEGRRLLTESDRLLAAGLTDRALDLARQSLQTALAVGDPDSELQARAHLIRIHRKQGQWAEALAVGEPLTARETGNARLLAEAYLDLGECGLRAEQYLTARLFFRHSARLSQGSRQAGARHSEALLRLACCCMQLGELDEAAQSYAALAAPGGPAEGTGLARLGLGSLRFLQGEIGPALALTREARDRLEALGHPAAVYARHNQGVMEGRFGHWDRSIELLQDCLAEYERQGETWLQAAALEELAECLLVHRCLSEALEMCGQALSLLGVRADSFLRGRLYRQAAAIHLAGGDTQRAHDLGLVSLELFRHLGARLEIAASRAFLDGLR